MSKTITIDEDFFEHLLGCMANQKSLPTMAASDLATEREKRDQDIIDTAYQKSWKLLVDNSTADEKLEDIAQYIINDWNDGISAFDLANALKEFIRIYLMLDSASKETAG
jgi:hypothetical protein